MVVSKLQKYCALLVSGKKITISFLAFLPFFGGCGYTLNHRLQDSFKSPQGIFIPVFENKTQEVGTEIVFTNALIRELLMHGEKVSSQKKEGTLELRGTVTRISRTVEVQSAAGIKRLLAYQRVPDQIGVRAYVLLELVEPSTKTVKWSQEFTTYRRVSAPLDRMMDVDAPSSLGNTTESLIENSYPLVARDMMRDAYDAMMEIY